jgi:adenosylcobinamide kinase/adenosylcobinamide-phosphate guanylyltransferase
MKKILYFGGQKSGKSLLSEKKALELSKKPYYIATYDNSFGDNEMQTRIDTHKLQREDNFITIEEPKDILKVIKNGETYLVDCLSMWLLNNMENENSIFTQIEKLKDVDANIVFVLNEVTSGVIPIDGFSRRYVDLTGIIGQKIVQICDEVYEVKFGLEKRLK